MVGEKPPRRRISGWIIVLPILGLIGGGVYYLVPVDKYIEKVRVAAGKPTVPAAARTLTIQPGLTVTCTGDEPVRFTAARIYETGKAVPCMRGWLGVTEGNVDAQLDAPPGANPFAGSSLRLRFALGTAGPKMLSISSDEGNPGIHELDASADYAEYIYRGGADTVALRVEDGKIRLVPIAVANADPS